jgi:prevent-host-death family protein
MTMKRERSVGAAEFKARCLALLDEVAQTRRPIVVRKRGRSVARVVPIDGEEPPDLRGSVLEEQDLLAPIDAGWEADR